MMYVSSKPPLLGGCMGPKSLGLVCAESQKFLSPVRPENSISLMLKYYLGHLHYCVPSTSESSWWDKRHHYLRIAPLILTAAKDLLGIHLLH